MERVLITGAAGGIGRRLRAESVGHLSTRCACPTLPFRLRPGRVRKSSPPTSPTSPPARRVRGHRRHRASRRPVDRGRLGDRPSGQYRRLLQSVRGRAAPASSASCLPAPTTSWDSTRAPPGSTIVAPPRPELALRRQQGVRRGDGLASTPTSSGWACCASASAILRTSRSTAVACRSGSVLETSCSWCGSGWSILSSTSRSSMGRPRASGPGGTMRTRTVSDTGPKTNPSHSPPGSSLRNPTATIWSPSGFRAARSAQPNSRATQTGSSSFLSPACASGGRSPAAPVPMTAVGLMALGRPPASCRLPSLSAASRAHSKLLDGPARQWAMVPPAVAARQRQGCGPLIAQLPLPHLPLARPQGRR